ncbi:Plasmid stabilisation system protein [Serratia quinivorans]|jgi:plasmid stabilization system protein ParE|uniref:type II toxin-antitoxin system RelE/ParE family toxin n=1 Tax=Serratia quinivorans TaxID=137545 RepID=UPI00217CABD0|nr:type II toxin-antitoxin system RelE/ParE family toxin [Serratia quinivorans]CAI1597816.1 Plasmid stabilisation system protein [Serratia quinivorans]CAI1696292.1 Plasmid stabilisation system protein [Serratia quinivorans]CAI1964722.1 Plasmid stabilisation system protein [Serratia quinivorans]CAI2395116.1 Plasmid stabilisation system protein [Serratia quinivorans]
MKEQPGIEYTATAKGTLVEIIRHLKANNVPPMPVVDDIINAFEARVSQFSVGCQICPELLKIGCDKYRECNTPNGYRVIYSLEDSLITVHTFLTQKQDIQQLLFNRLIAP